VRFAQRLGYPGYPELIGDIQEDVKRDLRAVYEPPAGDDSPGQILRRNLMQDRNTLEYMHLHLDVEMVDTVVDAILHASRLFVAGEGSAGYMAEGFALQLLILGLPAHAISGELAGPGVKKGAIQPGDVFLGLGLTAMTPGVSVMLKMARAAKAKTVGIVGSLAHPLAAVAEHVLVAPVQTSIVGSLAHPLAAIAEHVLVAPVQTTESIPSWTALAGMLNGLAQTVAICRGEPAANGMLDSDQYLNAYAEMLRQQLSSRRESAKAHALKE
jgi:DNA-binding MurR/RpiR family transcriptional regulator